MSADGHNISFIPQLFVDLEEISDTGKPSKDTEEALLVETGMLMNVAEFLPVGFTAGGGNHTFWQVKGVDPIMSQPEFEMIPIGFTTESIFAVFRISVEGGKGTVADELIFIRGRRGNISTPQKVFLSSLCDHPIPVNHRSLWNGLFLSRRIKLDEEFVIGKDLDNGAGSPTRFVGEEETRSESSGLFWTS